MQDVNLFKNVFAERVANAISINESHFESIFQSVAYSIELLNNDNAINKAQITDMLLLLRLFNPHIESCEIRNLERQSTK